MTLRVSPSLLLIGSVVAVLLWPARALAHAQGGEAAGLVGGLLHPISGADHVLAMVAVGIWGAQLGRPAIWLLPVTFPMVMALGGMLGLMGVSLPGVEVGIATSAIVLGAMVACEVRPPVWVAAVLVGVFAVFHGYSHGTEVAPGTNAIVYSIGFVIATGCLHAVGIGVGLICRWRSGRRALRVMGIAVAVTGLWFLFRATS
jgi:urease accessory protein